MLSRATLTRRTRTNKTRHLESISVNPPLSAPTATSFVRVFTASERGAASPAWYGALMPTGSSGCWKSHMSSRPPPRPPSRAYNLA